MDSVPNEEIELLSVSAAADICKIDRHYIADAIKQYASSNGRIGLAFVMMPARKRRYVRRSSLKRWFEQIEKRVCYA